MIWVIIIVVFIVGAIGGLIGSLFGQRKREGGLRLWDPSGDCQFPGLIIDTLLGGIAAVAFWSIYGSFSWLTIIGVPTPDEVSPRLTAGELGTSLLIGVSGASWLLTEAGRRCAKKELTDSKK